MPILRVDRQRAMAATATFGFGGACLAIHCAKVVTVGFADGPRYMAGDTAAGGAEPAGTPPSPPGGAGSRCRGCPIGMASPGCLRRVLLPTQPVDARVATAIAARDDTDTVHRFLRNVIVQGAANEAGLCYGKCWLDCGSCLARRTP
ncbi:MAG: hypothetical protein AAF628_27585 [Planctomycetota bacterium]